jgi:hypothetical protein
VVGERLEGARGARVGIKLDCTVGEKIQGEKVLTSITNLSSSWSDLCKNLWYIPIDHTLPVITSPSPPTCAE